MPIGNDTYMVSRQAATGFSGSGTLKSEAFQEASRHCENQGKSIQVISTQEASPPYILGNFPKAEVQFMCLEPGDRELARPKLSPTADKTVEIRDSRSVPSDAAKSKDIYAELINLDDLRKRGIISESEFDIQKKRLLRN
jgi:hypothetical protein